MLIRVSEDVFKEEENAFLNLHDDFRCLNIKQMNYVALFCEQHTGPCRKFIRKGKFSEFKRYCAILAGYRKKTKAGWVITDEGIKLNQHTPEKVKQAIGTYREYMVDDNLPFIDAIEAMQNVYDKHITAYKKFNIEEHTEKKEETLLQKYVADSLDKGRLSKIIQMQADLRDKSEIAYELPQDFHQQLASENPEREEYEEGLSFADKQ